MTLSCRTNRSELEPLSILCAQCAMTATLSAFEQVVHVGDKLKVVEQVVHVGDKLKVVDAHHVLSLH